MYKLSWLSRIFGSVLGSAVKWALMTSSSKALVISMAPFFSSAITSPVIDTHINKYIRCADGLISEFVRVLSLSLAPKVTSSWPEQRWEQNGWPDPGNDWKQIVKNNWLPIDYVNPVTIEIFLNNHPVTVDGGYGVYIVFGSDSLAIKWVDATVTNKIRKKWYK